MLAKNPGVSLIAIVTLALGIGANTAIFSVINAFLLRPLPYGDPDRLVMVDSQSRGQSIGVSFPDYEDWRRQNNVFEDLAFFNLRWNANLEFGNETETLNLTFATGNLFSTLRVAPALGHGPTAGETDTILLSHGLWQRRSGSDPAIIGRQLRIDGRSMTVGGVMPPEFRFPFQSDLWWLNDRYFNRHTRDFRIDQTIARLKAGVSPAANTIWQSRVWSVLLGIFSGMALVLATAGIYAVMAYFVTQRTREIGVRIALGAQWRDVLKLALRSGMLLVTLGLTIGLAGALALTRVMSTLLFEVSPTDPITFGAVALSVIEATLLACYIPARRATKVDPLIALRYE